MIELVLKGQQLIINQPLIASDTIDYLSCTVYYEAEVWKQCSEVWAHFSKGSTVYDVPVVDGVITRDKHLNLSSGEWRVCVHGVTLDGMRITTNYDTLWISKSGVSNGKPLPEIPLSATEQISMTATMAKETADEAKEIAQSIIGENFCNNLGKDCTVGCKGYYIKSIDLTNKKIYLSNIKVMPTISTANNTDKTFKTPAYEIGAGFNIINKRY